MIQQCNSQRQAGERREKIEEKKGYVLTMVSETLCIYIELS